MSNCHTRLVRVAYFCKNLPHDLSERFILVKYKFFVNHCCRIVLYLILFCFCFFTLLLLFFYYPTFNHLLHHFSFRSALLLFPDCLTKVIFLRQFFHFQPWNAHFTSWNAHFTARNARFRAGNEKCNEEKLHCMFDATKLISLNFVKSN